MPMSMAAACGYTLSRAGVLVVVSTLVIAIAQFVSKTVPHALYCTAMAMPSIPNANARCSAAMTELGVLYTAAVLPSKTIEYAV